jgi:D-tyrosyl-tRNA(Tyr) deacylase
MKVLIQRVKRASVWVKEEEIAAIDNGLLLFVGICKDDTVEIIEKMAYKVANIRLFSDEEDKMNLSIQQVNGRILSVSQFTLCANNKKGHRPSFDSAMNPDNAKEMFDLFNKQVEKYNVHVQTGVFQEHMNVILDNDGPVTIDLNLE